MPVPDETYFGERLEGGSISYGQVRQLEDETMKLKILKARLDTLLIKQFDALSEKDEKGEYKVYGPFALNVLTFLAIETLGHIINDIPKIKKDNEYEQSKAIVTPIYKLIDLSLSNKPSKKFYKAFEVLHGSLKKESLSKYSDVIHIFQRNTFNHGYQARGVFVDYDPFAFQIDEDKGYIVINPYLFWEKFKVAYEKVFDQILKGKNANYRKNALSYFDRLLN
ncbi:hypothetical protein GCM10028808_40160 [Spirosoma migulaei]